MEIYGNLASNMTTKWLINRHFSLQVAYATILAGFASFFMQIHVVDSFFRLLEVRFVTVFFG